MSQNGRQRCRNSVKSLSLFLSLSLSLFLSLSLSVDEHRTQTRHLLSKRGRCPTGRVAGARSMADPKLFLQKKKKPNRIRKTISLKVEPFWISGKGDDSAVANVIDVVELRTRFSLNFFLFWLGNFSRFLRVLGGGISLSVTLSDGFVVFIHWRRRSIPSVVRRGFERPQRANRESSTPEEAKKKTTFST